MSLISDIDFVQFNHDDDTTTFYLESSGDELKLTVKHLTEKDHDLLIEAQEEFYREEYEDGDDDQDGTSPFRFSGSGEFEDVNPWGGELYAMSVKLIPSLTEEEREKILTDSQIYHGSLSMIRDWDNGDVKGQDFVNWLESITDELLRRGTVGCAQCGEITDLGECEGSCGMMFCRSCLHDDGQFCENCLEAREEEVEEAMAEAGENEVVDDGAEKCPECGSSLTPIPCACAATKMLDEWFKSKRLELRGKSIVKRNAE